jgi:hypothetical protein
VAVTGNPSPLVVVAVAAYVMYHVTKAIEDWAAMEERRLFGSPRRLGTPGGHLARTMHHDGSSMAGPAWPRHGRAFL